MRAFIERAIRLFFRSTVKTFTLTIWPALTTVRQPVAAMARKAVELLMEEIRLRRLGETLGPMQHFMNFTLVKRESSAPLAVPASAATPR